MNNSTVNIPLTKVYVKNKYLGLKEGFTEAYWYGITSVPGRQFLCHVMLYNGSNWYGLPISSLSSNNNYWLDNVADAQAYDCFSYDVCSIRFDFLRDQRASIKGYKGTYMFTIVSHDVDGKGPFAEFPEQTKTFTFLALDIGPIICGPNNYIDWVDNSLYDMGDKPKYERIGAIFRSGK